MTESNVIFPRIAVIGLGLIGSSIGHAVKRSGLSEHIAGYARSEATRNKSLEIGFVDSIHDTVGEAVEGADLIILCTPVGVMGDVAREMAPSIKAGAVVSDAGSVKSAIIEAVLPHLPEEAFLVPGHPVAGTEESGPESGFADLFDDRWCILTPLGERQDADYLEAVARLQAFWEGCGANVECMDAKHHDLVLAITSHVPHLIAYNIVGTAADLESVTESEVIKFSAGGFRDFTRIAASDPTMWRDIFLNNKEAVLEMLGRFNEDLTALQRAIRWDDGDALFNLFTHTRSIRRSIIDAGQEADIADFGRHDK